MNKAFLKEPDALDARCPRCGTIGQSVGQATLQAHLPPEALLNIAESAWFCPTPRCAVAYYDLFERVVETSALFHPVYPKDPTAPICSCFGLTEADIDADIAEGVVTRTRAAVEQSKSDKAQCTIKSPHGQSCVAIVQGYYLKNRK
ncbi:MAG: hypothetical protein ACKVT0_15775 [Planctomycetaceae bacterium]